MCKAELGYLAQPAAPASANPEDLFPILPRAAAMPEHRNKVANWPLFHAAVARAVNAAEIRITPEAQRAMADEYAKLDNRAWDNSKVRSWPDVAREARKVGVRHLC